MKYASRRVVFLEVLVWINRNFTFLYSDKRLGDCRALLFLTQFTRKTKKMSQKCRVAVVGYWFKQTTSEKGKKPVMKDAS